MESFNYLDNWLDTALTGREYNKLRQRTERACLKIAPFYGDNTGTKQIQRWELNDKLTDQADRDALQNTEEKCREIRERLLAQIPLMEGVPDMVADVEEEINEVLNDPSPPICPRTGELIKLDDLRKALRETTVCGSDEIPIGFDTHLQEGGRFEPGNVVWLKPPTFLYDLREYYEERGDGSQKLLKKTQRKSHKTDRRLTGDFKTNREHRWEAHPQDPQAATRYECWRIEAKLLAQVFEFEESPIVPDELREDVEDALGEHSLDELFHCPISGQTIHYKEFMSEVQESDHGRSSYQIGHLDPIAVASGRHEEENVSWISERGNRVQGEDSLKRTVRVIFDMAEFHMGRLDLSWEEAKEWEPDPNQPSTEIAAEDD